MPKVRRNGRTALCLEWMLTLFLVLAVAVPAHAIDVLEWVGVIGVSSDGKRYALCQAFGSFSSDEKTLRDECANFQVPRRKSRGIFRRNIYVCRTVLDPPNTDDVIQQLCEKSWEEVKNDPAVLKNIESEVKAAGIQLGGSVRYLPVRKGGFLIPAEVVKQFDMSSPIHVSWSYDAEEWRLEFRAKGYGVVSMLQARGDHGIWAYELTTVTLVPGTPWLFYNVGTVMEEAYYKLPWAIRLDHLAARLLNSRGFDRHKHGDFAGSAGDFGRAFALDPEYGQAAFNAACAEARLGNTDKSLQLLRQAIGLKPAVFKRKARKDPDLDSIRGEKEFSTLLHQ